LLPYPPDSLQKIWHTDFQLRSVDYGIPKSIVSDRDPLFLSNFWKALFKAQGTQLKYSTAYHPETDGQTDVVNRTLESYLRCFASDYPRRWYKFLHWAEYWHNSSYHSAILMTPFQALYGRPPLTITDFVACRTSIPNLTDLLRLQHYKQSTVNRRTSQKLAKRFFGPFKVTAHVGSVAYQLDLPSSSKIHPVVHISLLRPYYGNDPQQHFKPLPDAQVTRPKDDEEERQSEDEDLTTEQRRQIEKEDSNMVQIHLPEGKSVKGHLSDTNDVFVPKYQMKTSNPGSPLSTLETDLSSPKITPKPLDVFTNKSQPSIQKTHSRDKLFTSPTPFDHHAPTENHPTVFSKHVGHSHAPSEPLPHHFTADGSKDTSHLSTANCFPPRVQQNLEDKVLVDGKSIDSEKMLEANRTKRQSKTPIWLQHYYQY
jgi:hypothetical protein